MGFPGFAVATEAIPGMTVRVSFIARRVDVNTVMFAQVLGNIIYGVKFGIRADFAAVFTVIHLQSDALPVRAVSNALRSQ